MKWKLLIFGLLVLSILIFGCTQKVDNLSTCDNNCKKLNYNSGECKTVSFIRSNSTCEDRYNMATLVLGDYSDLTRMTPFRCSYDDLPEEDLLSLLAEESVSCCCKK